MGQEQWQQEVVTYIDKTRFGVLAYVRNDGIPLVRSMGSFVPSGQDLYFSTRKEAAKVKEISDNGRVSFLFEHDNQELNQWKSVLLIGDAVRVDNGEEYSTAVELLSTRNPRFRERVEKGELAHTQIFKLKSGEIEFLDYGKGFGHVEKVVLHKNESL